MDRDESSGSFPTEETAPEKGLSHVPECYVVPSSHRPTPNPKIADVPIVDLAGLLDDPEKHSAIVKEIGNACRLNGFFQVVNHGIEQTILDGALSSAFDFFNLPTEEKMKFMSNDVHKPVRYSTSLKDGVDKIQFWRVFLKHYAHPLKEWVHLWPNNPPNYREKMGKFAIEVRKLAIQIMEVITQSLGIGPNYISKNMEDGAQVMAVNCFPPCPHPDRALGLPPHSDYTCLTIVLQSCPGLEIIDSEDGSWRLVPELKGLLQVHIGDHVEVLSNGIYKSVVHRIILQREKTRMSIASLHSLGMDEKMETAKELVDEQHPKGYKESSFSDFLNFLSNNDIAQGKSFINTLKIK